MIREHSDKGVTVRLDLGPQVIALDAPEIRQYREPELTPAPTAWGSFVSASLLAHKAKQFDDALYAEVERQAQRSYKAPLLQGWADAALRNGLHGEAARVLFAACELGGAPRALPAALEGEVASVVANFLADARRSQPLGFYTDSPELSAIFRQDRMLMEELSDGAATGALAALLEADPALAVGYTRMLTLARELTNPPAPGVHDLLARDARKRRILVPSRSHETDLILRLFGGAPIPDGFDLLEELIARIAAGKLSLAPRADSGWYDHQSWALEPLVAPERSYEQARLALSDRYRGHLKELFKTLLALTRETHIKQLEPPITGAGLPFGPPKLYIQPELDAEPLASHYARRAQSYRFVREVLKRAQLLPDEQALDGMEALFHGAHVRVCRQLGLPHDASVLPDRDADADVRSFQRFRAGLERDAALRNDSRMMVPVFFDEGRRKMKVWALLGWSERPLALDFATAPRVLEPGVVPAPSGVFAQLRQKLGGRPADAPRVEFVAKRECVAYPVTVELYVDRVLDRPELRALCDRHKTESAILRALQA